MTSATNDSRIISLATPSGLLIEASCTNNRVLKEFYGDYDAAFVLPNEKEGYAGFAECLELNSGEAYTQLLQRYGVFREFVVVAYDPESRTRVGGANFIAFPLRRAGTPEKIVLSINLNYIFINPDARNRGYFKRLVRDMPALAFRLLNITNRDEVPSDWKSLSSQDEAMLPQTLMFIEQNDPFRMSVEDYQRDTRYSGLDQFDRIGIWTKLGAKIIDFPYVQPPLTSEQEADRSLVFAVLGADSDTLDACLLHDHLLRFFSISVLKGRDLMQIPSAAEQLTGLQNACRKGEAIALLNAKPLMNVAQNLRPASLREALRSQEAPE
jgi:hypothetical protein